MHSIREFLLQANIAVMSKPGASLVGLNQMKIGPAIGEAP
jgi:hypothetical protein